MEAAMRRRTRSHDGCCAGTRGPRTRGRSPAAAASVRTVPVSLDWSLTDVLLVLTATTPWRGEMCHDRWSTSPSLDLIPATVADAPVPPTQCYVARASVAESSLTPDTTYTFSYAIVIRIDRGTW